MCIPTIQLHSLNLFRYRYKHKKLSRKRMHFQQETPSTLNNTQTMKVRSDCKISYFWSYVTLTQQVNMPTYYWPNSLFSQEQKNSLLLANIRRLLKGTQQNYCETLTTPPPFPNTAAQTQMANFRIKVIVKLSMLSILVSISRVRLVKYILYASMKSLSIMVQRLWPRFKFHCHRLSHRVRYRKT